MFKLFRNPLKVLRNRLSTVEGRKEFLQPTHPEFPQDSTLLRAAQSIHAYSKTDGYKEWEKEAWEQVNTDMSTILSPRSTREAVDMARGSLRATLDLLGVADKAYAKAQELAKNTEAQRVR